MKNIKLPYRYDYVGSFLRPDDLKKTRADYEAGKTTYEALKEAEDTAIRDLVAKQKAAGYKLLTDGEFRRKFAMSPYFCLPHYTAFVTAARERMSKKEFSSFFADISHIESRYFDKLSSDVSLFVKKFDYRYENEPWGDSRDSTERAIKFLTADIHRDSTEKKPSGGLT